MASKQFAFLAFFAIVLPAVAMATEFTVGDDSGWTINFDYNAWAKDKVFRVGDNLVFKYPVGQHNVFKVNGTAFANCTVPPTNEGLTSGNDVITLSTPGRKWYICGVSDHCASHGQKLVITVLDESASPSPAPYTPKPSTPGSANEVEESPAPAPSSSIPSTPGGSANEVAAPSTPAAPAPSSAYNGISVSGTSGYQLLVAAMVAVAFLFV